MDSDKSGLDAKNKLKSGLYKDSEVNLLDIKECIAMDNSEVEDIIPYCLLSKGLNHIFLSVEDSTFDDIYDSNKPLLPQIQSFAKDNGIDLNAQKGWKVELAKSAKKELSKKNTPNIDEKYENIWINLFNRILMQE